MSGEAPVIAVEVAPRRAAWEEKLAAWAERLSDRINPLVVKEVRQGLRTRIFWITFTLLLAICVIISLIAYAEGRGDDLLSKSGDSGRSFFYAYFFGLGVVQFLILPYNAYRSLVREREDETWVLLTLTGLGPRRILRGKLTSSIVQGLLYGSAIGPFLLFSYYLNGIDLPSILIVVVLGGVFQVFITAVAVCAATLAENRIFRGMVNMAVLFGLLLATGFGLSMAFQIITEGHGFTHEKEFLAVLGICLWAMLSSGLLLFEVAVARLSLPTENYAKGPRLALLAQVVGTAVAWALVWYFDGRKDEPATAMQVCFCAYLALVGMFMATDVDGQAPCHRARRGLARAFTPGALRGFRFVAALLLLSTMITEVLLQLSTESYRIRPVGVWAGALAAPAYALLYLSLPILAGRLFRIPALATPVALRLLFVFFLIAGSGGPPLVGEVWKGKAEGVLINTFNPLVGMLNLLDHPTDSVEQLVVLMVVVAGLGAALLTDRVLERRDREALARGA